MSSTAFILALLALLLVPGPTNTLLVVAGATHGLRRSPAFVTAEMAGYLLVVAPLASVASALLHDHPDAAFWIKLCSAAWIALLAIRLWGTPTQAAARGAVTPRKVFVTTVLNPKALIIGLVLIPRGDLATIVPWLVAMLGVVAVASLTWLAAGRLLLRSASEATSLIVRRIAATFLVIFSLSLAGSSLGLI